MSNGKDLQGIWFWFLFFTRRFWWIDECTWQSRKKTENQTLKKSIRILEDKEKYQATIINRLLINNKLLKKLHIFDKDGDHICSDISSSCESTQNTKYILEKSAQLV